ncbi:hypothetical protein [Nonomuraea sp. 10N515B]|uniref:hypothetical protein n=1 Tax=Nonomuraea sp. 10N515B TaxID=3457422 RepID=UPI003FCEDDDF
MNWPHLMALLGHRVTITNPDSGTTWTGDLIAVTDEPSIVIDQGQQGRMTLPQRFTINRADYTPAPIPPWEQEILDRQAATISLENTLLAHLGRMLANLQAHIDQRAEQIAQPHIDEAREQVANAEEARRATRDGMWSLRQEHARRIKALEGRAVTAETAIVRALATLNLNTQLHADDQSDYRRGYQACATHVTHALNGTLDQEGTPA